MSFQEIMILKAQSESKRGSTSAQDRLSFNVEGKATKCTQAKEIVLDETLLDEN